MGRKKGSGRPWQEHFWKRVKVEGQHWIWLGRFQKAGGSPTFTRLSQRAGLRYPVSEHAVRSAYLYAYDTNLSFDPNTHTLRLMAIRPWTCSAP